jgi:hypothetical protein
MSHVSREGGRRKKIPTLVFAAHGDHQLLVAGVFGAERAALVLPRLPFSTLLASW